MGRRWKYGGRRVEADIDSFNPRAGGWNVKGGSWKRITDHYAETDHIQATDTDSPNTMNEHYGNTKSMQQHKPQHMEDGTFEDLDSHSTIFSDAWRRI